MGCRVARSRFTVVSKVSGHVSIGPTGVLLQSKRRVSSAISPSPKIRGGLLRRGFLTVEPDLDLVGGGPHERWVLGMFYYCWRLSAKCGCIWGILAESCKAVPGPDADGIAQLVASYPSRQPVTPVHWNTRQIGNDYMK